MFKKLCSLFLLFELSFDNAKSEVIAHYIQNNIADDNFIKSISNDTSLMHRIINWLNDFITNLTGTKEQKAYIELRNKYKQALNKIRVNTKVTQDGMKYSISKTFKENIRDIAKNKYIGSSYNALEVRNNTPDI